MEKFPFSDTFHFLKKAKATLYQQLIFKAQQDDQIKTLVAQLREASLVKERGEEEIKAKFAAEMEEVCVLLLLLLLIPVF